MGKAEFFWVDITMVGIPSIKGVYPHPVAAGGFGMMIVSLEKRYTGTHNRRSHSPPRTRPGGAYFTKWIFAVSEKSLTVRYIVKSDADATIADAEHLTQYTHSYKVQR